jgi:F-type H+-transporting ATPase subunit delta
MYQQIIARRYAKSLMLSLNESEFETVEQELKNIEVLLKDQQDFYQLFKDPAFSLKERKAVITRIKDSLAMNKVLYHFLLLLIDKDRFLLLPLIYHALVIFIDDHCGRVRASINSATPIDAQKLDAITQALMKVCKKNVVVKTNVSPELLGGIRVTVGDVIFDGTVRAKLEAVKNNLLETIKVI